MLPTVEERIDSVIRALATVVLASIPADDKLAREQVQLGIGHLSIVREQIALLPEQEREALDDALALARAITALIDGENPVPIAIKKVNHAIVEAKSQSARDACRTINSAIAELIERDFATASPAYRSGLIRVTCQFEQARALKERRIFKAYGFDNSQD